MLINIDINYIIKKLVIVLERHTAVPYLKMRKKGAFI